MVQMSNGCAAFTQDHDEEVNLGATVRLKDAVRGIEKGGSHGHTDISPTARHRAAAG
jgi:hypothetical protein